MVESVRLGLYFILRGSRGVFLSFGFFFCVEIRGFWDVFIMFWGYGF